jgi:plasmid stabilization system protein ParE
VVKRGVIWTSVANRQLRETLHYWKIRNGSNSYPKKILKLINTRISVILKHPESYKTTPFIETRISAMGHFSILYKFRNNQLIITSFWDNRQDPDKLYELLKRNS